MVVLPKGSRFTESLTIQYCTKYNDSRSESALLLSAGLYDVLMKGSTDTATALHFALASGWLHCTVQPANLVTQQPVGSESGSL